MKPYCFVLMPFGRKIDSSGRSIDFDGIYREILAPAITAAGIESIRADEEQIGGTIHKPMFERLLLCDYAIADVTSANPNVYYELGIRHALRPRSTLILFAQGTSLPFDIALLRGECYQIDAAGQPAAAAADAARLETRLRAARGNAEDDSPLFQLLEGMPRVQIDHRKTDIFREQVAYSEEWKARLAQARRHGADAVRALAADAGLANLLEVETGVTVDLLLSLRDVKAHAEMIALCERMPAPLRRTRLVREQLAFALNRESQHAQAEKVLLEVIAQYGASSETNGLLGRIYKDLWEQARAAGRRIEARGWLQRAVSAYLAGFQADWRDAYPGVNALTLMEMGEQTDPRQRDLAPVVRYAALQRATGGGDYWDHATLLEIAVLGRSDEQALEALGSALSRASAAWQLETTARNLRLIREARSARGEDTRSLQDIEVELTAYARRT
jgi:MAP3K TRAFs-binding domain